MDSVQTIATPTPAASSPFDERVKAAKKAVVSSGMRVGRTGMMLSTAGAILAVAAWKIKTPVSGLGVALGIAALLFGIVPFLIGWGMSKAGAPFLRALSEPLATTAVLMDSRVMSGNRRSLSLLLNDGTRQTIALKDSEAREMLDLVGTLSPKAERGERETAQRVVAQLMVA